MPFESFSHSFPITIVWDQHSTPFGIFSVCVCLFAGMFYQQAPKRSIDNTTTFSGTGSSSGAYRRNEAKDEEAVSLTSTNETFEK